jgi:hypothetical protein
MQDERDILTLTDDDGNEIELEILRYFFYNGEEYAMVAEPDDEGRDCDSCDKDPDSDECDCEPVEVFFMKVEPIDDENEEYTFVDEDLAEALMNVIDSEYDEMDEDDEEADE